MRAHKIAHKNRHISTVYKETAKEWSDQVINTYGMFVLVSFMSYSQNYYPINRLDEQNRFAVHLKRPIFVAEHR